MDVAFYANLRQMAGGKHVAFDLAPSATVRDLLDAICERFPAMKPFIWEAGGGLSDYIKVFVDGRESRHLQGLETPVPPDASVDVFPPAAGG